MHALTEGSNTEDERIILQNSLRWSSLLASVEISQQASVKEDLRHNEPRPPGHEKEGISYWILLYAV